MPVLTRWFLKTSFLFLILAMLLGLLQTAQGAVSLSIPLNAFTPVYFHLLMLGWVTQLIFGVVFWMFPKFSRDKPRGSETLGWIVFWLLNLGLVLRLVAEPAQALNPNPVWGWALALSSVMLWIAGMVFVINTWARVKER